MKNNGDNNFHGIEMGKIQNGAISKNGLVVTASAHLLQEIEEEHGKVIEAHYFGAVVKAKFPDTTE